ncbi:hypothetical protein [Lutibacter citreus]|uniref:hypothetical protein n=1 Tax=Lutibacter citreus TaxID=2138210 RepID=UPI000DBE159B|nr:hypothetical protein [Lutibacter citreus]
MYINIKLEQHGTDLPSIPFKIELDELQDALENCYMQLGTPYDPIKIDNFVTVGKNAFSQIDKKTKVSISLETDQNEDDLSKIIEHKLVCCKVKNVDKTFINEESLLNHWEKIFEYNKEFVYSAPDGTLYISPNKDGKCVISTKNTTHDYNVSYSILISMKIKLEHQKPRQFYLILDPLVKVSSTQGTRPPDEDS